jgi:hypothetical protein
LNTNIRIGSSSVEQEPLYVSLPLTQDSRIAFRMLGHCIRILLFGLDDDRHLCSHALLSASASCNSFQGSQLWRLDGKSGQMATKLANHLLLQMLLLMELQVQSLAYSCSCSSQSRGNIFTVPLRIPLSYQGQVQDAFSSRPDLCGTCHIPCSASP